MSNPLPSWPESELVMISALQHWSYCPRQCGLIHLDHSWDENLYTLKGRAVHELVDEPGAAVEKGVVVHRGMPMWSDRLGLVGKADVVEFRDGVPTPVEYKHGPKRASKHDDLQLAAQALCLEEMTGHAVSVGAVFHHTSRRRRAVKFTPALRSEVEAATKLVREMLQTGRLPPAVNDARCPKCSLIHSCMPAITDDPRRARERGRSLFVVTEPA